MSRYVKTDISRIIKLEFLRWEGSILNAWCTSVHRTILCISLSQSRDPISRKVNSNNTFLMKEYFYCALAAAARILRYGTKYAYGGYKSNLTAYSIMWYGRLIISRARRSYYITIWLSDAGY